MKRSIAVALVAALFGGGAAADAPGLAGAYLIAKRAQAAADFDRASTAWRAALAADPSNMRLAEKAIGAAIAAGDLATALPLARSIEKAGLDSQMASMAQLLGQAKAGRWSDLDAELARGLSVGPLVDGLARGWVRIAAGDLDGGIAAFETVAETPGLRTFGLMHKAYALGTLGEDAAAEAVWSGRDGDGTPLRLNRRSAEARIAGLARLGRTADALLVIDRLFPQGGDPGIVALRAAIEAGGSPAAPIAGPLDGLAETFLSVATALRGEATDAYTLLYARGATMLAPVDADAAILTGTLLRGLGRPEEAIAAFSAVPEGAAWHVARIGLAETLREVGRLAEAIGVLDTLAATHGHMAAVHSALGDALREDDRHGAAAAAYSDAIDVRGPGAAWRLHYARAVARDRAGDWDGARADLMRALELEPEQPKVLNYLGYSMVERGEDLPGALELIEAAAAAQPESGFIADSLGWVLYQMGQAQKAVPHLERAVSLMPTDAEVNDHLGDIYWAVGRHREARFQWRRALAFTPSEPAAERLREKLRHGVVAPETIEVRDAGIAPDAATLASDG